MDNRDNFESSEASSNLIVDYKVFKWIVSSCLQKSLRRGRYDLAQQYVRFLWEHDRNYITYRFGTILTEDVGIANLPLVNQYLDTNLAKRKIDDLGGLDFILNLTQQACESVKDRSSCDSAYLASYYPFENMPQFSTEQDKITFLQAVLADESEHYIQRIQAAWILLGDKKFKHEMLNFDLTYPQNDKDQTIDNIPLLLSSLKNIGLNEETLNTIEKAYATQIENMCLGVPVVSLLYQEALKAEEKNGAGKFKVGQAIEHTYVKEISFYHEQLGMDFISAGIDGHTREGKTAYYRFLKLKNKFNDYMYSLNIPSEKHFLIFSHCMFRTEGHEVNKRIYFPGAVSIMRDCEQQILIQKSENEHIDFNTIKKILIEEMPRINQIREDVILKMELPMIEKPQPKVKKKP